MTIFDVAALFCFLLGAIDTEAHAENTICVLHDAAKEERVEFPMVTAVAWHESRFYRLSVSREGARGVLQVLPVWLRRSACISLVGPAWKRELRCGVRLIRLALETCKSKAEAIGWYHSGKCKTDGYARMVVRTQREMSNGK